jgi:hypothetical protein
LYFVQHMTQAYMYVPVLDIIVLVIEQIGIVQRRTTTTTCHSAYGCVRTSYIMMRHNNYFGPRCYVFLFVFVILLLHKRKNR